jgi:hypothetical protein
MMMIDSQEPLVFVGEAVNTAVNLHQQTPNEGLTKREDRDSYQAPYPTPYAMLQAFGKPSHDNDGNEMLYWAPHHHLQRFGCCASRLIPKSQGLGKSQRNIEARYDGRLRARFDYNSEDMGPGF